MTVSFRVVSRVRERKGPFEAGACRNTGLKGMDERGGLKKNVSYFFFLFFFFFLAEK
jgi:hypothetical protein